MKLNAFQECWLAALESGKYRQTNGRLVNYGSYCCLGVACRLAGVKQGRMGFTDASGDFTNAYLPASVTKILRLRTSYGGFAEGVNVNGDLMSSLSALNDDRGMTFAEIASYIRKNPSNVFK